MLNIGIILSIFAGVLICYSYFPYIRDIHKGKVIPARSTRFMLFLLLVLALLQQKELGSGYTIAVTVGEVVGSLVLLLVAIKHGIGGVSKIDLICIRCWQ